VCREIVNKAALDGGKAVGGVKSYCDGSHGVTRGARFSGVEFSRQVEILSLCQDPAGS
jgi:hypothetical protein